MKKINKKISKFLKVTLLLCMIFSQLANPVKVLADEIVPSYNIEMELDTENDKFILTSNGTKELVDDENYILEIVRSFKYVDNTLNEDETKTTYDLVLGSLLTNGIDIAHEIFNYNGVSYIDINVYEITDDTIDFAAYTEEDYKILLTTEKVENIINTSFEENVSYNDTSIEFIVTGENVDCDNTDGYKCVVAENENSNDVDVEYVLETGDLNPNKTYHTIFKVNDVTFGMITNDVSVDTGVLSLDFMKLLPGSYNLEYEVRDDENKKIVSNEIEFSYMIDEEETEETDGSVSEEDSEVPVGSLDENEEFDKLAFIKDSELSNELFISYTILTDEEKNELGNEYRFLDSPLAFLFDNLVTEEDFTVNYNLFDENIRYHVVMADNLLGAFDNESEAYKVIDVLTRIEGILSNITQIDVSIVDANGNKVNNDSYIENGMKLVANVYGEILEYDFLVYGDVDGGYVENSDLSALIDKVLNNEFSYYDTYNLDFNKDELIDVKDISVLGVNIFDSSYHLYDFEVVDEITSVIEADKDEVFIGESFEVVLSLDGFDLDYINAIEGIVSYDEEALKLDKVEMLDELFVGNYLNNKFVYASDETFSNNGSGFVKLTFTTLKEGNYKVSVKDIDLVSDGVMLAEDLSSNEIKIVVNRLLHTDATLKSLSSSVGYFDKSFDSETLDYTLYVDSSVYSVRLNGELNDEYATTDDFKTYILTGDNTRISINVTAEDGTVLTYKVNVRKIYKSSNNNLSNIIIDGYDIDFRKDELKYNITVGSDVVSLDINAIVEHYGAWAKIEGNENFHEGENVVTITVYAENGSAKTYTLLVNKEAAKTAVTVDDEDVNNLNTEKIIIIILIVLVVAGLLYLIFKNDEDDGKEPKIEQIKSKKQFDAIFDKETKTVDNKAKRDNNKVDKNYNKANKNPKNKNKVKK